mmetsp:Transcript_37160/g.37833  ORF Transcript_37160/g.37833 Transcript_37160/m.37833 type:complete len:191 (-) Transcript_37160:160-732(-)
MHPYIRGIQKINASFSMVCLRLVFSHIICTTAFRPRPFLCSRLMMLSDYSRSRPPKVVIPVDKLDIQFSRSSGAGGQNVNKLSTKAEVRFNVDLADWLPEEVKSRLQQQQSKRINNIGELVLSSQEHRTQSRNKEDCIQKLKAMVEQAYIEPKERNQWKGIGEKGKAQRRDMKSKRSEVKKSRSKNINWD